MRILTVQNRMGIGDMVIFLPFIEAISKKFKVPVSLLVKENSKATQFLKNNKFIDKIIILDRDNKSKNGRHDGLIGSFKLLFDLKKYSFDKIFIFNSSFRFHLIAKAAGIKEIYQYPLFKKSEQHITDVPKQFIKDKLDLAVNEDPEIQIDKNLISKSVEKFNINKINTIL